MTAPHTPLVDRIMMNIVVNPETACWLWEKSSWKGYGIINVNARLEKTHRVSYQTFVGPVPEGLELDHLCRNRLCCNPKHLEPVTRSENNRRGLTGKHYHPSRGEHHRCKTHCKRGHPLSGDNLLILEYAGYRRRDCRTCARMRGRNWKLKQKALKHERRGSSLDGPSVGFPNSLMECCDD